VPGEDGYGCSTIENSMAERQHRLAGRVDRQAGRKQWCPVLRNASRAIRELALHWRRKGRLPAATAAAC